MNKETLLEKAKKIKTRKIVHWHKTSTDEDLDLVLAWLKNEIGARQMCQVKGVARTSGNYLYYCASVLKKFYLEGKLIIKKAEKYKLKQIYAKTKENSL